MISLLRNLALALTLTALTVRAENPSDPKPTLFLIGDSTVKNGTKGQVGWGTPIAAWFDAARIRVENRALGGRSSRSYLREGLWDAVEKDLKPGDFVIIQFGHNDGGPLDEGRARASLKGNGDETKDVVIKETQMPETVHSYGWYIRHYVEGAKAKGAQAIVCSLVPRNIWTGDKVGRAGNDYGKWAQEAAAQSGAKFIDLNSLVADAYDQLGPDEVMKRFFDPADHTHTLEEGAKFTAEKVVEGIRSLRDCPLAGYIVDPSSQSTGK